MRICNSGILIVAQLVRPQRRCVIFYVQRLHLQFNKCDCICDYDVCTLLFYLMNSLYYKFIRPPEEREPAGSASGKMNRRDRSTRHGASTFPPEVDSDRYDVHRGATRIRVNKPRS